jgi:hypothetical protein
MEYILVQDNCSHWYVIPDDKLRAWFQWTELDSEDEASWDVPYYAKEVGGCPALVKFKEYRID